MNLVTDYAAVSGNNRFVPADGKNPIIVRVGSAGVSSQVITGDVYGGTKWAIVMACDSAVTLKITVNWSDFSLSVLIQETDVLFKVYPLDGSVRTLCDAVVDVHPATVFSQYRFVLNDQRPDQPTVVSGDNTMTWVRGDFGNGPEYALEGLDSTDAWVHILAGRYVVFTGCKRDGKRYGLFVGCSDDKLHQELVMPWVDQLDLDIQRVVPNAHSTALFMTFTNLYREPGQSKSTRQQYCAVLEESTDPESGLLTLRGWRLIDPAHLPPNLCTCVSATPVERRSSARLNRKGTASRARLPIRSSAGTASPTGIGSMSAQLNRVAIRSPQAAASRSTASSATTTTSLVDDGDDGDGEVVLLPGPPLPKRTRRDDAAFKSMVEPVRSPPRDDDSPELVRAPSPVYPYSDELEATVPQYEDADVREFQPPAPPKEPVVPPQSPSRIGTPEDWFDGANNTAVAGTLPELPIPPPLPQSPPQQLVPTVPLPRANQSTAALAFRDKNRVEGHHVVALTDHSEKLPHVVAMMHALAAPGLRFAHTTRETNESDNAAQYIHSLQSTNTFAADLVGRSPLFHHMLGLGRTSINRAGHTAISNPRGRIDVYRTVVEQAVLPPLLAQVAELAMANAALHNTLLNDKIQIGRLQKENAELKSQATLTAVSSSASTQPDDHSMTSQLPTLEQMADDTCASASGSGSAMRAARMARFSHLSSSSH